MMLVIARATGKAVAHQEWSSKHSIVHPATLRKWIRDAAWMVQQAKAFVEHCKKEELSCKILMHDNDCKYSEPFLDAIKTAKIKPHRTAIRSPNKVAYVERVVQSIKQEVLEHFIEFGHKHMDYICDQFRIHYLEERPHQGLNNELIEKSATKKRKKSAKSNKQPETIRLSDIRCHERLGGLLKSYSRKAA